MRFSVDHKVIPESLTPLEAPYFIRFLKDENERHQKEIEKLTFYISNLTLHPLREIYGTAVKRHEDDIVGTNAVIKKVRRIFKL